jgi:hypothetical protein
MSEIRLKLFGMGSSDFKKRTAIKDDWYKNIFCSLLAMAFSLGQCGWNRESCDLTNRMAGFGLGKKGKAAKLSLSC